MATYNFPETGAMKMLTIDGLKGVDFLNELGAVHLSRSPDMLNMISDQGGRPVKRYGYERMLTLPNRINGIFRLVDGATEKQVIHSGTKLYEWDGAQTATERYASMADVKSTAFQMDGKLWILDGKKLLCYGKHGETYSVKTAEELAYTPTTTIGALPTGGGEKYEAVNLIGTQRINRFAGTAADTVYQLDAENISGVVKCEKMNAAGGFEEITGYAVDHVNGKVTFTDAPGVSPVTGDDNVRITFTKNVAGYADRINKCTIFALFGVGAYNRVFVSGSADYPNVDWYSDISAEERSAPCYFPDNQYAMVGQDNTRIMGYLRTGEYLAILKEENGQDATAFLRSGTMADGKAVFTVKQGIAGVGAISRHGFGDLRDDHLFLSRQGVFALSSNAVTSERYAQARSELVNKRLCAEPGLAEASSVACDGYFYVAVNGHVYVADAAQKSYAGRSTEQYQYEWYYWENVPARCLYVRDGRLYFGTEDGNIMRFYRERKFTSYNDDGAAILARWTTPEMALSTYTRYKTVRRLYTKLNPYARSSVKIYMKEEGAYVLKDSREADVFDFSNIDFNRLTFNTDADVYVIATRLKVRRVVTTQIKFENDEKDEAFGLYGATVYYDMKTKVK